MLSLGADVNARNYDGRTALHLASSIGDAALVATLLAARADILHDAFGNTAWDDAARNDHGEVIAALQSARSPAPASHLLDSQLRQAVARSAGEGGKTAVEHGNGRDHDLPAAQDGAKHNGFSRASSNASSVGEAPGQEGGTDRRATPKHHHLHSPG